MAFGAIERKRNACQYGSQTENRRERVNQRPGQRIVMIQDQPFVIREEKQADIVNHHTEFREYSLEWGKIPSAIAAEDPLHRITPQIIQAGSRKNDDRQNP